MQPKMYYLGFVTLCRYLKLGLMHRLGIKRLDRIAIAVTYRCNSRCKTCDIWQTRPDVSKELTLSDFYKLSESRSFRGVKQIILTGGEPFLRDDIVETAKILTRSNTARLSFVTNGLLPELIYSRIQQMKAEQVNISTISISLDGKPSTHDLIRGVEGSFGRVVRSIHNLQKLNIPVQLIFTITPDNYDQIEWVERFAEEQGIYASFFPSIRCKRFDNLEEEFNMDTEKVRYVISELQRIFDKRRHYFFDDAYLYYIEKTYKKQKVISCTEGFQDAYIMWDGEVYACEALIGKEFSFGNIKEHSFDKIWKSNQADSVRDYIKQDKCQPCFISCGIMPSLAKEFFTVARYTFSRRLVERTRHDAKL